MPCKPSGCSQSPQTSSVVKGNRKTGTDVDVAGEENSRRDQKHLWAEMLQRTARVFKGSRCH